MKDNHTKVFFWRKAYEKILRKDCPARAGGGVVARLCVVLRQRGGRQLHEQHGGGTGGGSGGSSTTATYTITFNKTKGSGDMSPQTGVTAGVPTQLKKNTFTAPDGQRFKGWAETEKGDAMYVDGGTITKYEDIDLYAVWGKDGTASYTVKHFKQETLTSTSYKEVPEDQKVFEGPIGEPTTATANTYKNYTHQKIVQKRINSDNSTVVEIKYDLDSATGVKGFDPSSMFQSAQDLSIKHDADNGLLVLTGDYIVALAKIAENADFTYDDDFESFDDLLENRLKWYVDGTPVSDYPSYDFSDDGKEMWFDINNSRKRIGVLGNETDGYVSVVANALDSKAGALVYSDAIYVNAE